MEEQVELSGHQKLVYDKLTERDEKLGKMYLSALQMLQRKNNIEYFVYAAHNIRELMEKLPESIAVKQKSASLKEKVMELHSEWKVVQKISHIGNLMILDEQINGRLKVFLTKADDFFKWFDLDIPSRREQFSEFWKNFMNDGNFAFFPHIPDAFVDSQFSAWKANHSFFTLVSHHRFDPDEQEFHNKLEEVEKLLLRILKPETEKSLDFATIDALIHEGQQR